MDVRNERMVFDLLVNTSCKENNAQVINSLHCILLLQYRYSCTYATKTFVIGLKLIESPES
jgi:hypothetical protein